MARLIKPQYIVTGHKDPVIVGQYIEVRCARDIQLFTQDIWDENANDNVLRLKCRPDKKFDVPVSNDLPECLAQCSAAKPTPPADFNIVLDTSKTSPDKKLWERQELW